MNDDDRPLSLERAQLAWSIDHRAARWVLALSGELDLSTVAEARRAVGWVLGQEFDIHLDLRALSFIDSSGLHFALRLAERLAAEGSTLLVTPNGSVRRLLEVAGVADRFEVVPPPEPDDGLGHAVIATDRSGLVAVWNREAERLYGWSATEVLGRSILTLTVGPDDADLGGEIMREVLASGIWEGEFVVRRRDGTRFAAHVRDMLVRDRDGNPAGIIGVSIPATALSRTAQLPTAPAHRPY